MEQVNAPVECDPAGDLVRTGTDLWRCECGVWRPLKEEGPEAVASHERRHHGLCGQCKISPCICWEDGGRHG